jgi:hypothetical protein
LRDSNISYTNAGNASEAQAALDAFHNCRQEIGSFPETLSGLDLRTPQARRAGALRFDHPVAVGEIGRAVDGQLGLLAAQELVGADRRKTIAWSDT